MFRSGGQQCLIRPAYSTDNSALAVVNSSNIKIYSPETKKLITACTLHQAQVTVVKGGLEGTFWSGSLDGHIMHWSPKDPKSALFQVKCDFPIHNFVPVEKDNSIQGVLVLSRVNGPSPTTSTPDYRFTRRPLPNSFSFLHFVKPDGSALLLHSVRGRAFLEASSLGRIVLAGKTIEVFSYDLTTLEFTKLWAVPHPYLITCLAMHEETVAFGDDTGRIGTLQLSNSKLNPAIMHWHSSSVKSLALLQNGQYLLSGGEEGVLVLWRIADQQKQFMPDLGDVIEHVAIRPDLEQFLVATHSNDLVMVNSGTMRESGRIGGLQGAGKTRIPNAEAERVCIHPGLKQPVVKGVLGCLQVFDPIKDRVIASLQVIEKYLTDPSASTPQADLECFAFSPDGQWLVTAEGRVLCGAGAQDHLGYLKFWERDSSQFGYSLHSVLCRPHSSKIKDLDLGTLMGMPVAVTVSEKVDDDQRAFKLYRCSRQYDNSEGQYRQSWRVCHSGIYNGINASSCKFNTDSTNVCFGFGHEVVIFAVASLFSGSAKYPELLFAKQLEKRIKRVEFLGTSLLAFAESEMYLISLSDPQVRYWPVTAHSSLLVHDKLVITCSNTMEKNSHWLIVLDARDLGVLERTKLDKVGRSVVDFNDELLLLMGDFEFAILGSRVGATACGGEHDEGASSEHVLEESMKRPVVWEPATKPSLSRKSSTAYLFRLCTTQQLPPMKLIFRTFFLPHQ